MAAQPRPRDVAAFYGIPFAAPPVGNLRFRPPQPLNETWEDCLYLDLFAPNDAINSNASLPVFLWVHGGGFASGVPENGTALASVHNIIIVSIRYRLGHFGFFASPASLSQEGTTGNWGTLDQQFAMKWIQANIAAFGGDPDKVPLAGQSAGAFSVMWHLVAPGSAGLFHRAIMESGTAETPIFFQSPNDSYSYHSWVATRLCGCNSSDDLECPRKVNVSALRLSGQWSTNGTLRATFGPPWASILFPFNPVGPVIDGSTLPDVPLALVQKGDFNKVPLIVGGNRDEGTAYARFIPRFIQGAPPSPTADFFNRSLEYAFQNRSLAKEVASLYPLEAFEQRFPLEPYFSRLGRIIRDEVFYCPNYELARAFHDWKVPAFLYSWNVDDLFGALGGVNFIQGSNVTAKQMGFFHSAEIPFVFKKFTDKPPSSLGPEIAFGHPPRTPHDAFHNLSDFVTCMWFNFMSSGRPFTDEQSCLMDGITEVDWPPFNDELNYLHIGFEPQLSSIFDAEEYPNDDFTTLERCDILRQHRILFRDGRIAVFGLEGYVPPVV
ncbi:hypothetical protein FOL47_008661 [Perkinsus chesapeaki]|uniref:Carboxylic ester hydrolase n=1 Tax=Perkinsus chesapeaki TaxID=330153 RepID=A0A7J6LCI4_PERCH|nr:hypothetical protein FOL47_008661 [Perkinsus chesapeaki]